jgi:hypothetical protein
LNHRHVQEAGSDHSCKLRPGGFSVRRRRRSILSDVVYQGEMHLS